mmetsp:Transcript_14393/g.24528  ORF Transcript_14393/g.24528 Transcript_14393/m.24528 type:complete len:105 (+) Transcript_14393:349-663(+)
MQQETKNNGDNYEDYHQSTQYVPSLGKGVSLTQNIKQPSGTGIGYQKMMKRDVNGRYRGSTSIPVQTQNEEGEVYSKLNRNHSLSKTGGLTQMGQSHQTFGFSN